MSCGQGSVILAHGLTPEEAMLRGNNADFWLVSFTADDLAEINAQLGLRLQFVLDTDDPNFKPDPANPTDPWHGNVFGLPPNGSNALEDVQIEFARRAVWRKPPHSELLGEWIPGALERVQRAKEQNKVNELKNMIGMTSLLGFPNADTTRAQFEAMLADAVSKLPRKVRCGSCKAEFRESFAKDLKVCPKCKASPFKSETIPTNA
ncbi:MAG: hypothetical protein HPKKFMNG_00998 [Planctomycetes bacterium]|nr:hypothetical protein [Planctomycetota bacterium]